MEMSDVEEIRMELERVENDALPVWKCVGKDTVRVGMEQLAISAQLDSLRKRIERLEQDAHTDWMIAKGPQ
jgi:chaperonin cofactor prefoldin